MKPLSWLLGALLAGAAVVPPAAAQAARAEGAAAQGAGTTAATPAVPTIDQTLAQQQPFFFNGSFFQFVPGIGFVPSFAGQQVLPFGFSPFSSGIVPGFGAYPFSPVAVVPVYGYTGRIGPVSPFLQGVGIAAGPTLPGPYPPVWNVVNQRAAFAAPMSRNMQGPRIATEIAAAPGTPSPSERVAGERQETPPNGGNAPAPPGSGAAASPSPDAEQLRLAGRLEAIMRERPLTEGEVTAIGATGVQVRYPEGGRSRTARFDLDEVYFFRSVQGEDELRTAASAPEAVTLGMRVLVPLPPAAPVASAPPPAPAPPPAAATAGRREETPRVVIRSRREAVAGTRQVFRRRRAAR